MIILLVQTHCHSRRSDGREFPKRMIQAYADNGFDALAITDHRNKEQAYDNAQFQDEFPEIILFDACEMSAREHYVFIKAEDEELRIKCFDGRTEILTNQGWKYFSNLSGKELVATLNSNGELVFQKPEEYIEEYYDGKMFHQSGRVDILCTPNHNLYVDTTSQKGYRLIEAKNLPRYIKIKQNFKWIGENCEVFVLPYTNAKRRLANQYGDYGKEIYREWDKKNLDMDTWLEFLGWFLSEGYTTTNEHDDGGTDRQIGIASEPDLDEISDVVERLGFHSTINQGKVIVRNKQLFDYLKRFGKAKDKYIPHNLLRLKRQKLRILFNSLMEGDGSKHGKTSLRYKTVSKQLADDVQELALKLGYVAKISKTKYEDNPDWNDAYNVWIRGYTGYSFLNYGNDKRSWVDYKGKVYCVRVPNEVIYIRRKGKCCWIGNCHPGRYRDPISEVEEWNLYECSEHARLQPKYLKCRGNFPVISDDSHSLNDVGSVGILVDAEKEKDSILKAIKRGDFRWYARGLEC